MISKENREWIKDRREQEIKEWCERRDNGEYFTDDDYYYVEERKKKEHYESVEETAARKNIELREAREERKLRENEAAPYRHRIVRKRIEAFYANGKNTNVDPTLFSLVVHCGNAFDCVPGNPIYLKLLIDGSTVYGQLISYRTYLSRMSESLSIIDREFYTNFDQYFYIASDFSDDDDSEFSNSNFIHIDTSISRYIARDLANEGVEESFKYLRISLHKISGFSIYSGASLLKEIEEKDI